jgi:integrase
MTPRGQTQKRNRIPGISRRITKRGEVRWRAVVDIGEGADRKQMTRTFLTQDEAEDWRADILTRRRRGDVVEPSRTPLADYFADWLEVRSATIRPSTAGHYDRMFALVADTLGPVPLAQITPSRIERAYATLATTARPSTQRGVHRIVAMVLRTAVRDGLIAKSPLTGVRAPGNPKPERSAWTVDQARVFLAGITSHAHADAWHVFLECWLRSGELRALRWSDLDLANGTLTVARTVTRARDLKLVTGPPKSAASRRTLLISPELAARLRTRRKTQQELALETGVGWTAERLVFPGATGGLMTSSALSDSLKTICARLDLPYVGVHGLRHTGGSIAYAQRVPTKLISERMGHESAAFTESLYLHTDAAQHRDLADLMRDLLAI